MNEQDELMPMPASEPAPEPPAEPHLPHKPTRPKRRTGNLVWPFIMILLGAILLLDNLNLFDDSLWDIMWRFWPLIFIALGLDGLLRRKEIFGPVFAIGLGTAFILANFGVLAWDAWTTLLRMWPLLIVAVGLDIIFARRAVWLSLIWVLVIFGLLAGGLWLADVGPMQGQPLESEIIQQPLQDANRAQVVIAPAVGQLQMSVLEDSTDLIAGQADGADDRWTKKDFDIQAGEAIFSLQSQNAVVFPGQAAWDWQLDLTPQIPLELEIAMGVGEMRLELADLTFSRLEISQGVGDVHIELPAGDYQVEISQAIGQIVLSLPEDAQVRLEVSRAISSFSPPAGYERRGDFYYSPGFEDGADTIDIDLSQAIGNISVSER